MSLAYKVCVQTCVRGIGDPDRKVLQPLTSLLTAPMSSLGTTIYNTINVDILQSRGSNKTMAVKCNSNPTRIDYTKEQATGDEQQETQGKREAI